MRFKDTLTHGTAALLAATALAVPASAQPINLSNWTVESGASFEAFAFDEPFWEISLDRLSVTQRENPDPSFFYSDFEVETSLKVWVEDTTRNDGPRLEIDLQGDFSATAGRFGCYSNSQPRVECANVRREALD